MQVGPFLFGSRSVTELWRGLQPKYTKLGAHKCHNTRSAESKQLLQFHDVLRRHRFFQFHQVVLGRDREKVVVGGSRWWTIVKGHEAISSNYLIWVTSSGQEKRVIVWWKTNYAEECETEVWCAQILIEIWDRRTILGFTEWSENVFTFQGCHESDDESEFLLHSALVKHDYWVCFVLERILWV